MAEPGTFEWFDLTTEDRDLYISRILFNMGARGITDPLKQHSTFFSVCGQATYSLAWAVLAPRDLVAVDFSEILEKLKNQYSPQPSLIALRHAFHTWSQAPGESMTGFITALWNAACDCKFGELEEMLRDRFVCGLQDEKLQKQLLAKGHLTFQGAQEEALAYKFANWSAREVQQSQAPTGPRQMAVLQETLDSPEPEGEVVHQTH